MKICENRLVYSICLCHFLQELAMFWYNPLQDKINLVLIKKNDLVSSLRNLVSKETSEIEEFKEYHLHDLLKHHKDDFLKIILKGLLSPGIWYFFSISIILRNCALLLQKCVKIFLYLHHGRPLLNTNYHTYLNLSCKWTKTECWNKRINL